VSKRADKRGPLRNLAEYGAVRLAQALFRALPERVASRLGRTLGRAGALIDRRHARIAAANIAAALGCDDAEAARIARRAFGHMGETAAEVCWASRWMRDPDLLERQVCIGFEAVRAQLATGRGAVIATAHLGNWERTSYVLPAAGIPFSTIARPLDNPLLWAMVQRERKALGQGLIMKKGAAAESARELAAGRVVAVLCDQRAKKNSITVPFFGRDALTTVGPAMIALRNRVPLFVAATWRRRDGRHQFQIDPPLPMPPKGPLKAQVRDLTLRINQRLEEFIRARPEQYLWAHDRWRPSREAPPAPAEP
jgi:KDO2-lipid IV(A) lauroyltransferase